MADGIEIKVKNQQLIADRLASIKNRLNPDSVAIQAALTKAAVLIVNQAKLNIRKHGLIDEGALLNSLRFEYFKSGGESGVRVGSFGIPYAAFWEFGFRGTMNVRAHNRLVTKAFGRNLSPAVVARVNAHSRKRNQQAKPYLRPAYEANKRRASQFILQALEGNL